MSACGLHVLDNAIQKTNVWLDDIQQTLHWDDRERAFRALRVVLHTLRDHLPLNESAQLAAQLPILIRGVYFEGWNPSHSRVKERHWDEFILPLADAFSRDPSAHPTRTTEAVFEVMSKHVSEGEIRDVLQCLPVEIRRHWKTG